MYGLSKVGRRAIRVFFCAVCLSFHLSTAPTARANVCFDEFLDLICANYWRLARLKWGSGVGVCMSVLVPFRTGSPDMERSFVSKMISSGRKWL